MPLVENLDGCGVVLTVTVEQAHMEASLAEMKKYNIVESVCVAFARRLLLAA